MGQNGLFHASSGSQIHLLTTVHPEIASRGSQWPVRRAGVPGEGAVTTVTAWPTVTRVREVRDQPTNIWRPGVRRMGDHPTNPGPGVREKGWQLGKTLGCRLSVLVRVGCYWCFVCTRCEPLESGPHASPAVRRRGGAGVRECSTFARHRLRGSQERCAR